MYTLKLISEHIEQDAEYIIEEKKMEKKIIK